MKGGQDPKDIGHELIRIRSLLDEAGIMIYETDVVDQAMIAWSGPDWADANAMIDVHKKANARKAYIERDHTSNWGQLQIQYERPSKSQQERGNIGRIKGNMLQMW